MIIPILDAALKIVDRVIPDPKAKQEAQLEIMRMTQAGEFKQMETDLAAQLAQIDVNKEEAKSANPFVSGWRPAVGWCGVLGLFYQFFGQPLLTYASALFGKQAAPTIDTTDLLMLLGGLLGFGGMRMWEKGKGVARD